MLIQSKKGVLTSEKVDCTLDLTRKGDIPPGFAEDLARGVNLTSEEREEISDSGDVWKIALIKAIPYEQRDLVSKWVHPRSPEAYLERHKTRLDWLDRDAWYLGIRNNRKPSSLEVHNDAESRHLLSGADLCVMAGHLDDGHFCLKYEPGPGEVPHDTMALGEYVHGVSKSKDLAKNFVRVAEKVRGAYVVESVAA